ncbi:MAG TPA: hypothetical protein DEQ88_02225 [Clostridiales bacterium]|nr:hypothetical protein [Clostridiales bacterium]
MTAFERRLAIISALRIRRQDTRGNLAAEFGVCKRTIENDVSFLSLYYPIYTEQGKFGGIFMAEDYNSACAPRMTERQINLLTRLLTLLDGEDREIMAEILKGYGG